MSFGTFIWYNLGSVFTTLMWVRGLVGLLHRYSIFVVILYHAHLARASTISWRRHTIIHLATTLYLAMILRLLVPRLLQLQKSSLLDLHLSLPTRLAYYLLYLYTYNYIPTYTGGVDYHHHHHLHHCHGNRTVWLQQQPRSREDSKRCLKSNQSGELYGT